MEKRTLIGLTKEYLSLPGEGFKEFSDEYKKLTEQDKADLVEAFKAMGFDATVPEKK